MRSEIPTTQQRGRETQSIEVLSHRVLRATDTVFHGPVLIEVVVTQATVVAGGDRVGTVCTPSYHLLVDGGQQTGGGGFADHLDGQGLPSGRRFIFGTELETEPVVVRTRSQAIAEAEAIESQARYLDGQAAALYRVIEEHGDDLGFDVARKLQQVAAGYDGRAQAAYFRLADLWYETAAEWQAHWGDRPLTAGVTPGWVWAREQAAAAQEQGTVAR